MGRDQVELVRDHAEAFLGANKRADPTIGFETERERETMIGLHNAIVKALASEKTKGLAA